MTLITGAGDPPIKVPEITTKLGEPAQFMPVLHSPPSLGSRHARCLPLGVKWQRLRNTLSGAAKIATPMPFPENPIAFSGMD
jgi:hypothetical protein